MPVAVRLILYSENLPLYDATSMPSPPTVTSSAPTPPQAANAWIMPNWSEPPAFVTQPDGLFLEGQGDAPDVTSTHIVYVIDNSGSMLSAFDRVVEELEESIGYLTDLQQFQVYFYSKGTFQAPLPGGLRLATDENKIECGRALRKVIVTGYGCLPISALILAFEALKAVPDKPGVRKVLFILSDGDFDSEESQYKGTWREGVVREWLRKNNADKGVHVYPIILGEKPYKETEEATKTIASENGGEYRFVEGKY